MMFDERAPNDPTRRFSGLPRIVRSASATFVDDNGVTGIKDVRFEAGHALRLIGYVLSLKGHPCDALYDEDNPYATWSGPTMPNHYAKRGRRHEDRLKSTLIAFVVSERDPSLPGPGGAERPLEKCKVDQVNRTNTHRHTEGKHDPFTNSPLSWNPQCLPSRSTRWGCPPR